MIAVVPARGGSKGIPGKNCRPIAGLPLVSWVTRAAIAAKKVSAVVVATDDPEIADIAQSDGAEVFWRSAASASDTAPTEEVLGEVLAPMGDVDFILLQPTSPLTTADDVEAAITMYEGGTFDSIVSVVPQFRFIWSRDGHGVSAWNYDPTARPRRQDAQPVLVENGAIYVSSAALLRASGSRLSGVIGAYEMSTDTYHEIDEPDDWQLVEGLLRAHAGRPSDADLGRVRLVLSDVDGVLTDNGMYWSSDGAELKRFSARDGKGFELLHNSGIRTALITSESVDLVARRGAKLGCHHVELGARDKVMVADRLRRDLRLEWDQIAFIGDDLHDIPLLNTVGHPYCPADAVADVRAVARRLRVPGGRGCFRELADLVLDAARHKYASE